VSTANVNLVTREASASFDSHKTNVETLIEAIRGRGYGAEVPVARRSLTDEQEAQDKAQAEEFTDLRRKAIASGALGAIAMLLSMPLLPAGDHSLHGAGDPLLGPLVNIMDAPMRRAMPWLYSIEAATLKYALLLLTVAAVAWAGRQFHTRARMAFRHRAADMNTLIAVGTGAAFLYSVAATVAPGFDRVRALRQTAGIAEGPPPAQTRAAQSSSSAGRAE
jgi:Cu+-exporting ATPase